MKFFYFAVAMVGFAIINPGLPMAIIGTVFFILEFLPKEDTPYVWIGLHRAVLRGSGLPRTRQLLGQHEYRFGKI